MSNPEDILTKFTMGSVTTVNGVQTELSQILGKLDKILVAIERLTSTLKPVPESKPVAYTSWAIHINVASVKFIVANPQDKSLLEGSGHWFACTSLYERIILMIHQCLDTLDLVVTTTLPKKPGLILNITDENFSDWFLLSEDTVLDSPSLLRQRSLLRARLEFYQYSFVYNPDHPLIKC